MFSVFIRLHNRYKKYLDDLVYIAMEEGHICKLNYLHHYDFVKRGRCYVESNLSL